MTPTASILRPLRDYQKIAITTTIDAVSTKHHKKVYYTLPTGTGKTRVFTGLVEHFTASGRVMVVAHREELIKQAAQAVKDDVPELSVGVEMAASHAGDARVVVGSIQTLTPDRLAESFLSGPWRLPLIPQEYGGKIATEPFPIATEPFSCIIFDECHHATATNSYATLITMMEQAFPDCVFIGCTATPFRSDKSSMLDVFPICSFQRAIPQMVDGGWLSPVVWNPIRLGVDSSKLTVGMSPGGRDYTASSVEKVYSPQSEEIAARVAPLLEKRPTIVFAATVEHAYQLTKAFTDQGLVTSVIESTGIDKEERRCRLDDWKSGKIQVMVNVGILTEGFDYTPMSPNKEGLAAVVIVRPTMSPSLYLQMLGRGTRLKPGGYKDCLVVDVVGNANLLETRQITLPRVMPTVTDADVEDFEKKTGTTKRNKKARHASATPFSVHINEGATTSWLAWGLQEGYYYTDIAKGFLAVLLPDPSGSGLYYPRVIEKDSSYRVSIHQVTNQADTLAGCMQHLNYLVATSGNKKMLDKDARWRQDVPSERQLSLLTKKQREQAEEYGWNKGEVGLALSWKWNEKLIKNLAKELI